MSKINTHEMLITFGKHNGERVTRLPRGYLTWMANEKSMSQEWREIAKAELKRRGTAMPKLEISGHAIDRASQSLMRLFKDTRKNEPGQQAEGIYSWLQRLALDALKTQPVRDGVYLHNGVQFVFEEGEEYPALKTVMPKKPHAQEPADNTHQG